MIAQGGKGIQVEAAGVSRHRVPGCRARVEETEEQSGKRALEAENAT